MIMNLPAAHFSMLFRPQFWLFFVANAERAFSFYWNMKFVFVVGGVFFLLMTLLRNNFYPALFGALWVFFSGYTQWWYSSPQLWPELVGCFALCTAALICMLMSRHKLEIIISTVVFVSCSVNFVLSLYPPHQVPLFYLSAALILGVLIRDREAFFNICLKNRFRWICISAGVIVVAVSLIAFWLDAQETLKTLSMTVYPGQRRSMGSGFPLVRIFAGFVGPFMSHNNFPSMWANVCESANFFLFFPIPLAVLCHALWKKRRAPIIEMLLAAFVLSLIVWDLIGFPQPLAKLTLFDRVTEGRSMLSLGIASIVWTCLFIDKGMRGEFKITPGSRMIVSAATLLAISFYMFQFNKESNHFLPMFQTTILCVFVTLCTYFLMGQKPLTFAMLVLVSNIASHALVNPICLGLSPILENPVYKTTKAIVERDPEAKWIVYGSFAPWPNLLSAAGAKVFNGVKYVPNLKEMKAMSSDSKDTLVYNRYGYISLDPLKGRIRFVQGPSEDTYTILVDPLDEHWRKLNVKYCASMLPFAPETASAVDQVGGNNFFRIYKYRIAVR